VLEVSLVLRVSSFVLPTKDLVGLKRSFGESWSEYWCGSR